MQNPSYTGPKGATGIIRRFLALCLALTALSGLAIAQTAGTYQVTNIISDGSVPALATDPHFINPWGISIGADFWINTQATGLDYVALTSGSIPFTVTIPAETGGTTATGTPTGTVFYSGTGFVLTNGAPAIFLFSSLDGIITGWNVGLGTTSASVAQVAIDNSAAGAVYTDMALLTNANGTYILAANFGSSATIDVFDSSFKPTALPGAFVDPTLPAGYAPYAVHTIGTQVFVTYAMRTVTASGTPAPTPAPTPTPSPTPTPPPAPIGPGGGYALPVHGRSVQQVTGPGNGIVSVFDTNGNFVARAITSGNLNAPWGVAIAPTTFGIYGGDLLVGNFGDGLINVYDPKTYAYLGQITDTNGKSVVYPSLWEITFGTAKYGDPNSLYFTAGLTNEAHGLFGVISNNPTATGTPTFGLSASNTTATVTAGSSNQMVVSVAPTNNFTGTVNLACSGLPAGATCTFSPAQLSVSPASSALSTVTIKTAAAGATLTPAPGISASRAAAISIAMLLPFGSLVLFSSQLFLLGFSAFALLSLGVIAGCSGTAAPAAQAPMPTSPTPAPTNPGTPTGQSQVTITATAGAITQSTVVTLNVQ
jgi:hypothetical protein